MSWPINGKFKSPESEWVFLARQRNRVFVVGHGSHSKEIWTSLQSLDIKKIERISMEELEHVESISETHSVLIGVGDVRSRARILTIVKNSPNLELATLIHSTSSISNLSEVGVGSIVQFGCVVSSDTILGQGVLINWNSTIGHDCKIGDASIISPGANISGRVSIGENSFIGAGAVILPNLRIGKEVTIGAGSVVTADVSDYLTIKGVPAK